MQRTNKLWTSLRSRKFLYNFLGAIAFYAGFGLLFALTVHWYTNHGKSLEVPDIKGKNLEEAVELLEDQKLNYMISDSSYDDSKPALTVIDQSPKAKSQVKEHRTIYLTVNSKLAPQITMPDLRDVSLKQASMILNSYGLKVGNLSYKPDLGKDVVLEMRSGGKLLSSGSILRKGARIDLVLGDGLGQTQVEVPNLIGLSLREARFVLDGSALNLGAIVADHSVKGDTLDAIVYKQIPDISDESGKMMNAGEGVDVFLTSPHDYDTNEN